MRILPLMAISLAILIGACSPAVKYELVIQGVTFFDGEVDRGIVSIGINGDTIAAINESSLDGDSIIDASGKFLIPGMVNAHIHAARPEDLREGYSYGILANLNMHTGLEDREKIWKQIAKDSAGYAFLYGAGHAATVPGGHPTQFSPGMETIDDTISIEEWVDHRIENGADYIKIIREHHEWMGYPPMPTLTYEQIDQIIRYAHSKGYLTVVHANTIKDFVEISKSRPGGFVHMPDYKEDSIVSDEDLRVIAESGVFIVPTGGISLKPMNAPPHIAEWIKDNLLDAQERAVILARFKDAGIPIVAGTDAQEGQMNFGSDLYYELDLYKLAGFSNLEILRTATGNAAKAFGIPVGILKVGSPANMVLLSDNPLEDLENLKKVERVWKRGHSL